MSPAAPRPPVQIALIGLNRLSASIGLGLQGRAALRVTGFDREPAVARQAQSSGAIAAFETDVMKAIEAADLIVLAAPLAEQRELFPILGSTLRPGGVIAAVSPLLRPPLAWAAGLPEERHVVACHPALNPAHLHSDDHGLEAARADLFAKGLWALAAAPGSAPEALKLLSDLAAVLGAAPFYVDPDEHDGLMAGAHSLPGLLAWALMQASADSTGWGDLRKLTDRGFANATLALADLDSETIRLNRDSVTRYLDQAIQQLTELRGEIAEDHPHLSAKLQTAAERRAEWLAARRKGEWDAPGRPGVRPPSLGETLQRMFVGGLFSRRDKD